MASAARLGAAVASFFVGAVVGAVAALWLLVPAPMGVVIVDNAESIAITSGEVEVCGDVHRFDAIDPGQYLCVPYRLECEGELELRVEYGTSGSSTATPVYVTPGAPYPVIEFVSQGRELTLGDLTFQR